MTLQNIAFVLIVTGILLLYCEFIWLGKLVFGIAGAFLVVAGAAMLAQLPHTAIGLVLLGLAIVAFALEAAFRTFFLAATAGTVLAACGFWKLCPAPASILPQLCFPVMLIFGLTTTFLLRIAKQARANKRADL